jgi:hypothetical protein
MDFRFRMSDFGSAVNGREKPCHFGNTTEIRHPKSDIRSQL